MLKDGGPFVWPSTEQWSISSCYTGNLTFCTTMILTQKIPIFCWPADLPYTTTKIKFSVSEMTCTWGVLDLYYSNKKIRLEVWHYSVLNWGKNWRCASSFFFPFSLVCRCISSATELICFIKKKATKHHSGLLFVRLTVRVLLCVFFYANFFLIFWSC